MGHYPTREERWAKMSARDLRRELLQVTASYETRISKLNQENGTYRGLAQSLRDFLNVEERNDYPDD